MTLIQAKDKDPFHEMELPFRQWVSFEKLIDFWKEKAKSKNPSQAALAKEVLDKVSHAEEILVPFEDISLMDKYENEIGLLLEAIFPEALQENEIKAASMPFKMILFNPSKRFQDIVDKAGDDFHLQMRDFDPDMMYIMACLFLINVKYQANIDFKRPFYFDIPDQAAGIMRHYRAFFNADFSTFRETENTIELTADDIAELKDNFDNLELWKKKIPPNSYDFEGFGLMTLLDVSTDQALSSLKFELLKEDALENPVSLEVIQEELRTWFAVPDLKVGISAFDRENKRLTQLKSTWNSILIGTSFEEKALDCMCEGSYDWLIKQSKNFVVSDVLRMKDAPSPLIKRLYQKNVNSCIIAPLLFDHEVIGFLELSSATVGKLNSILVNKLQDIVPLFMVALKRSMDEYNNSIKALVQSRFTAIHPSVSWKFTNAAEKLLRAKKEGRLEDPDDMVFKDVHPLYGQFDIRGSSTARNLAIQQDLIFQLDLAKNVIKHAKADEDIPIYDHLAYRLQHFIDSLNEGIQAGDEVKVLDFLQREIYPVFTHLEAKNGKLAKAVKDYIEALDPQLNVVYRQRKDYEDTVTTINDHVSAMLEDEQEKAQAMFPHYFEKYKTDGVEFNMYVGQSLMQNQEYHELHLKNLRIWQLQLTSKVVRMASDLVQDLKIPLEIASLILIHDTPLAIKFRMDEKQFDVDGAYNIRYEIIKKRIDKAYIKDTSERLTQPGKIALVYSQENEASEYVKYLEFLISDGYLEPEIERLELDDLQGASGLRALRVTVLPDTSKRKGKKSQRAKAELTSA